MSAKQALSDKLQGQDHNHVHTKSWGLTKALKLQGGPKKRGHKLMAIILSILTDLKKISVEDSWVNLQLNAR